MPYQTGPRQRARQRQFAELDALQAGIEAGQVVRMRLELRERLADRLVPEGSAALRRQAFGADRFDVTHDGPAPTAAHAPSPKGGNPFCSDVTPGVCPSPAADRWTPAPGLGYKCSRTSAEEGCRGHEEAREETLAPSIPLASGSTQESGSEPDAVSGDLSARQAAIAQILDKAAELGITPDEIQIYLQAKLTTAESRLDFHWRHPARQRQPKDNRLRRSLGIHASDACIGLISGRMPYPTRRQKRNPVT